VRRRLPRIGLYAVIALILAIAIFPFWWMLDTSLKQPVDIFGGVTLYPHNPTTSNYSRLFNTYHFGSYLQNSLVVVTISVAVSLTIGTLAAYALARFRMRFGLNQSALVVALLVRMIPGILLVIPLYITLAKWGLLNTRLGLILIYSGLNTSFVIWMIQSFLAEIQPVGEVRPAARDQLDTAQLAWRAAVAPEPGAEPGRILHARHSRHSRQARQAGRRRDLRRPRRF